MTNKLFVLVLLILCFGTALVNAQKTIAPKTPDYTISNLKIVPYDSYKGEFEEEIKPDNKDRSFFNDYSISLLVVVEVSIEKGGYEAARTVQITVREGKKIKKTKTEQMPPVEDNGKYYVPLWLDAGMCDTLTITAKINGQKTASTKTRSVLFSCGE